MNDFERELIGDHEIVGDVDMIGDDDEIGDYDMVGAARRPPAARVKGLRGPRAMLWRRQTLGINGTGTVAAGAAATITSFPQRDFKGKRLIVTSDVAFFFDITDVKVGQQSQNVGAGNMPAAGFAENAVSAYVDWDTANLGNQIAIFVSNIDAAAHQFRGLIVGLTAVPQY